MLSEACRERLQKLCDEGVMVTYKELCEYLNIPYKKTGSNGQKAQLRELAQYCRMRKGGKYYILSDYEPRYTEYRENVLTRMGLNYKDSVAECMYVIRAGSKEYVGQAQVLYKKYLYHLDRARLNNEYLGGLFKGEHEVIIIKRGAVSADDISEYIIERQAQGIEIVNCYSGADMSELSETIVEYGREHGYAPSSIVKKLVKAFENDDPYIRNNLLFMVRKDEKEKL